jgi:hypothetical protein
MLPTTLFHERYVYVQHSASLEKLELYSGLTLNTTEPDKLEEFFLSSP